jgi:hypothetical protein
MRDMQVHVRVLGAIYIAFAALGLLFALVLAIGLGGAVGVVGASGDPDAAIAIPIIGIAGSVMIGVIAVLCLPGLIAGVGLLYFKPWARVLGIVLAAVCLIGFPWLTILGAYGLWVLLSKDSERLFDSPSTAITPAQ